LGAGRCPAQRIEFRAAHGDVPARLGLLERCCTDRRARRAIGLAEMRQAARIGCRIMTLGRGTRINFPQNAQSLIASGKSRSPCKSFGAGKIAAQLSLPCSYHRRPGSCMVWNKQQNGAEPTNAGRGDGDECWVAIEPMTLHKEGTAQQSIIQYARRGCGAPLEVSARHPIRGSSALFVLHQHCLCCISTVCVKRSVL
jgi:hypothetical protein